MKYSIVLFVFLFSLCIHLKAQSKGESTHNPIIFADVPDAAIVRVGDTYYMSSTTMHMCPGVPIMKSTDLVNWKLVNYAYDTLVDNEMMRLENGHNTYGRGSWASSIRYHEGVFYVTTFSATAGKTHVYTTKDIEKGPWKATAFSPMLHDHSLFFDDDGRVYMVYGGGDIRLVELNSDLSGVKPGGVDKVIIKNAGGVASEKLMLHAEGSQLIKHNGQYYLFNITWPQGGMRTAIVHRASQIDGPYEGRVALQDHGIAQGCIIDTPEGDWYAYMFRDYGALGRIPYLIPMVWEDGWPVLGVDGKVPDNLDLPANKRDWSGIVTSDEFSRKKGDNSLPLAWQWNHLPDHRFWSLSQRKGYLRLTTGRVDADVLQVRNILTQRTMGPTSSASVLLDVSQMKDGDRTGLIALQKKYGYVGVKMEDQQKTIVMVGAEADEAVVLAEIPFFGEKVYFKIDCDFRERTDKAYFFYSLSGKEWTRIGEPFQMYYTLPHFMGYRFGLFNYATKNVGGMVDFDYFRISPQIEAVK